MVAFDRLITRPGHVVVGGVPEGFDALFLTGLLAHAGARDVLFVARDEARMMRTAGAIGFFAPAGRVVVLPAWDCLPYDRIAPNPATTSRRVEALVQLAEPATAPRLVLTTISAATQRLPPTAALGGLRRRIAVGDRIAIDALTAFLADVGYIRAGTVTDHGEFAVRGGILDVFVAGAEQPSRLDLMGDDVEGIRRFDPVDQRSTGPVDRVDILPMSEVALDDAAVRRFRVGYQALFGTAGDDPLYALISARRRHAGMEHWLPLFYERLDPLFDVLADAVVVLDHQVEVRAAGTPGHGAGPLPGAPDADRRAGRRRDDLPAGTARPSLSGRRWLDWGAGPPSGDRPQPVRRGGCR